MAGSAWQLTTRMGRWRVYFSLVALAAAGVLGYGSWRSAVSLMPPEWAPPDARPYRVVRVIDGDTVEMRFGRGDGTVRLRYLGIDAPELQPAQPFGAEAAAENRRLVEGARVWVSGDVEGEDPYGRRLGYVFANGEMVNRALVAQGYAEVMLVHPNLRYADELVAAQAEAREGKRGMWGAVETASSPEELDGHTGAMVRLHGVVTGVVPGGDASPTVLVLRLVAEDPVPAPEPPVPERAAEPSAPDLDGAEFSPPAPPARAPTVALLVFPEFRPYFPPDFEARVRDQRVEAVGRLEKRDNRFRMILREPGQLRVLVFTG